MTRSREAFWWSLFSAGGVLSALFLPAVILGTGLLLPFARNADARGEYEQVHGLVSFWLVRLVLFGVVFLSMFHCAHRIRHIVMDLGFHHGSTALAFVCYGLATAGAAVTAVLLLGL